MSPSISAESLRERIKATRDASERLNRIDYCGRLWLADYAADVDAIADCLEELLDQGASTKTTLSVDSEHPGPKDVQAVIETCNACGATLSEETERTTIRLLASLDPERRKLLEETYQGQAPKVLCAVCANATISMVNGVR